MNAERHAAVFLAAVLAASTSVAAEISFGKLNIDASLASRQALYELDSALNPSNILELESGYLGNVAYSIGLDFSEAWLRLKLQDFGLASADLDPEIRNRVAECLLGLESGPFFLDLGKRKIAQSRCFFMTPIDFAIAEDQALFRDDRYDLRFAEGKWMASMELFTTLGFFGAAYIPRIEFEGDAAKYFSSPQEERLLFRFSRYLGAAEIGLAFSYSNAVEAGAQTSFAIGDRAELHAEAVYREAAREDEPALELGIGATINLPALSAIVEYYYDGAGLGRDAWDERIEGCRAAAALGAPDSLGAALMSLRPDGRDLCCRHYAMLRLSNPSTETLSASLTTIVNLQDLSGRLMPCLSCDGWDSLRAKLSFAYPFGGDFGEFRLLGEAWKIALEIELWL